MVPIARCGCVSVCSCAIRGEDSECLATDVTGQGSLAAPYVIEVNPIISTDANNTLECRANGLFAAGANIIGDINNDGCVNTSVTENPDNTFTLEATLVVQPDAADPNGGPNTGNGLECTPTGALVAPSTEAGNAIRYGTDGRLYVSPTAVEVDAVLTDCLDLQITGNGTPGQPFTISGTPIIAPEPNGIECTPAGLSVTPATDADNVLQFGITDPNRLYVPPSPTVVNVIDNDPSQNQTVINGDTIQFDCVPVPVTASSEPGGPCLSVQGDTCNGFNIRLGIDPDPCNPVECGPNGLRLDGPLSLNNFWFADGAPVGGTFDTVGLNGNFNNLILGPVCTNITNPDPCRSMVVDMGTLVLGTIEMGPSPNGSLTVVLERNVNGGPFTAVGGYSINNPTARTGHGDRDGGDEQIFLLPPGGNVQGCIQVRVIGVNAVNGRITGTAAQMVLRGRVV